MKQVLGLFIGTESIGWSLVRQKSHSQIVTMGTRMFSSFVEHLGEGERESSKATLRTKSRSERKKYLRRKYRKRKVLSFLAENGFCPLKPNEMTKWRQDKKPTSRTKIMDIWLALDPYALREKGLREKISKLEMGRIIYHFCQRRGKIIIDLDNTSKTKTLLQGIPAVNRIGILHTYEHLKNQHLGTYLNSIIPAKHKPYSYETVRARNRYLDREMIVDEINALFDQQQHYHKNLSPALRHALIGEDNRSGLMFFKRSAHFKKLRGNIMTCRYEENKKVMWKSHPLQEWYDIYVWLDSIRLYGEVLTREQREKALLVATKFSSFIFKKVRSALKVDDHDAFNYDDSDKIYLSYTIVHLSRNNVFGSRFFELSQDEQHQLWHDIHFYSDKAMLKKRFISKWGLSQDKAEKLSHFKLKLGHGKLSMKAARAILPFLKDRHHVRAAVVLGSVKNAIGFDTWNKMATKKRTSIINFIEAVIADNMINNLRWIADFETLFDIRLNAEKLYITQHPKGCATLPINPDENYSIFREYKPVAQKPIFELRKIINKLIQDYGTIDQINFAMTPELKTNARNRKAIYIDKKIREQQLPKIHSAVIDAGQNPTHSNLMKYKLWLEWNKICPFTNTAISLDMLFSEEVSIVYILPWKRFFNDSDKNKTLCMRFFRDEIQGLTPYEYFKNQPSGVWEKIKTRVLEQLMHGSSKHVAYQKYKHFVMSVRAEDSVDKEFNDHHNLAVKVKSYLSQVSAVVVAARGNSLSSLRRKWGIKSLGAYDPKPRYYNAREPALNALVTALNDHKYLEELRYWNRYDPASYREIFPTPWKRFTSDVADHYNKIAVSVDANNDPARLLNQKKNGLVSLSPRGKLHLDSFYGKRKGADGNDAFHIRKSIKSLTTAKQINKIVDPAVRELFYDQIDLYGGFENGKIPKNALTRLTDTGWETNVFLPNRNGDKVPIRKVRMRENVSNAVQLTKDVNKYVNPRKNHHVMIYITLEGIYKEEIVSFWEAVKRVRKKEPLYQLPPDGRSIVTTLHIDDCFILGMSKSEIDYHIQEGLSLWDHVYRVQRISSMYYEFRQIYDFDVYSQTYPNYVRILNFGDKKTGWLTYNPVKISTDLLGNITFYDNPLKVPEMQ